MSSKVGVLSVVIAVSIGALAFKGVDIAQAFAEAGNVEEGAAPAETALTEGISDPAPASEASASGEEGAPPAADAAATAEACLPSITAAAEEMGLSATEISVLRSLQARREALDGRETGVETREQAAAAAEQRLQEQIAQLKAVEKEVQGLLASMDAKRDERMTNLVKSYEAMKPKDAAKIFDGMNDKLLIDIAKTMKPATLAAVMSVMQPKRAEAVTQMLADLAKPPENIDQLAKTPT
jgi:flagellar motility protein MotE (MotC chaperone)